MLGSLLPGLRDLRAPFVSGSLVLVAIVLFASGSVADVTGTGGRSQALQDLVSWVGRPGLAAAASLTAYLIGSLVVGVTRGTVRGLNHRRMTALSVVARQVREDRPMNREHAIEEAFQGALPRFALAPGALAPERPSVLQRVLPILPFSYDSASQLGAAVRDQVASRGDGGTPVFPSEVLREAFTIGDRRLRLASADLYSDFDRLISEAELRDGLLVPLPMAAVAVLCNIALPWHTELLIGAGVLVLLAVLFSQARRNDRKAFSLLVGALADHTFSTTSLDRIDWVGP